MSPRGRAGLGVPGAARWGSEVRYALLLESEPAADPLTPLTIDG